MSDAYDAMANQIIFGVTSTNGPVEVDVTSVADKVKLKNAIQNKGYDVGQFSCPNQFIFYVSKPKRRIYPIINNNVKGSS